MGFCMHIEGVVCHNCAPYMRSNQAGQWVWQPITIQPIGWTCPKCGTTNNPSIATCGGCPKDLKP